MSGDTTRLSAAIADRYRIERELGAGGMATVYLARDLKHDRDVAIKVLHPDLGAALGGERFLSEIKTTARLQHPHILPLLDSGAADGLLFYVMPLVTGETLRERLVRDKQLSIEDTLLIAREVADALAYAHGLGIIHRDIKPENILLQGGHALVADFGIALAVQTAGGQRMTQTGLSLGTPQYMSPEQAMGERAIDARSDIYALGAVTYEMLVGEPPFAGATVQSIVAKVLTEKPVAPSALRDTVPAGAEDAVLKALAKLPADRFATATAFAEALRSTGTGATRASVTAANTARGGRGTDRRPLMFGAVLALAGLVAAAWSVQRPPTAPVGPSIPLVLELPDDHPELTRFTVSPDGESFAIGTDKGVVIRDPGQREFRLLPGTVSGESPSFSPDGNWLAFEQNGRLRKISVHGGSATALVAGDSVEGNNVHWGQDGSIAFEARGTLYVAPPDGRPVRRLDKATNGAAPRLLPSGRGLLYHDPSSGSRLMYYDLATDRISVAVDQAGAGVFVDGYILYGQPDGGLFAVPFDPARGRTTGPAVPLAGDLQVVGSGAAFAVSHNGLLVYRSGIVGQSRLVVVGTDGHQDSLPIAPQVVGYVKVSPDGRRLAITVGAARGSNRHIVLFDLATGALSQFTKVGGGHAPVWSPDGRSLAFSAEDADSDAEDLFVQPVDGAVPPRRILRRPRDQHATDWPNDTTLVFSEGNSPFAMRDNADVQLVNPMAANATVRSYLNAAWSESGGVVSPDGRWMAYASDESGVVEVYVRPFPVPLAGAQWKVSSGGGAAPRWSPDGRGVFYLGLVDGTIHRADVRRSPSFAILSSRTIAKLPGLRGAWDVNNRTGQLIVSQEVVQASVRLVAIPNWQRRLQANGSAK